jgi:O-antigen ligase
MRVNENSRFLAGLTAGLVTTATFAKTFVPFYLIGSTAIFAATCLSGIVLVAVRWREVRDDASNARDVLVVMGLLYSVIVASYLANSFPRVPITHLLGILLFHAVFIVFGFAAARGLKVVFTMLLAQAAIYVIIIAQYTVRFGDLERNGFLQDVFGVGVPALVLALHQHIGMALGLGILASLGLGSGRAKLFTFVSLPFVLLFLFHIAARTAVTALVCSLFFLAWARLWVRSRKLALATLSILIVSGAVASGLFYEYALQDKNVDTAASDAVSRTIKEIQSQDPGFRLPMWSRAWHRIETQPDRLVFGRGIGVYPIDEGFGAPDWLLNTKSIKYYPHNTYLELLYETGIVGLLLFGVLTLIPLGVALKHWSRLSAQERSAISIYVFYLVSIQFSGPFAYSYDFEFFFALATGVICLKRGELAESGGLPSRSEALVPV